MSNRLAIRLEWTGEGLAFQGGGTDPASPSITVDGDGSTGPSPMQTLLLACAGCSAVDVVVILRKMRVGLRSVAVEVEGTRRQEEPRRYLDLRFHFHLAGEGLDQKKADRAVQLSMEKYCSVVHSLAPDIDINYDAHVA